MTDRSFACICSPFRGDTEKTQSGRGGIAVRYITPDTRRWLRIYISLSTNPTERDFSL